MAQINANLLLTTESIRAFTYNELELNLSLSSTDPEPYWIEAVYEIPLPLSLAPDKPLQTAKSLVGILQNGDNRQKRAKIYSMNDVYPEIYKLRVTLYIYDKDGAIAERKEYLKELECAQINTKAVQLP